MKELKAKIDEIFENLSQKDIDEFYHRTRGKDGTAFESGINIPEHSYLRRIDDDFKKLFGEVPQDILNELFDEACIENVKPYRMSSDKAVSIIMKFSTNGMATNGYDLCSKTKINLNPDDVIISGDYHWDDHDSIVCLSDPRGYRRAG